MSQRQNGKVKVPWTYGLPGAFQTRDEVGPKSIPLSDVKKLQGDLFESGGTLSKCLRCLEVSPVCEESTGLCSHGCVSLLRRLRWMDLADSVVRPLFRIYLG